MVNLMVRIFDYNKIKQQKSEALIFPRLRIFAPSIRQHKGTKMKQTDRRGCGRSKANEGN